MPKSFKNFRVLLGLLALLPLTFSTSCSSSACTGFTCDEGSSCLIVDGEPSCVEDGGIDGSGGNGPGEECDDDSDCQDNLACEADLNGNTTCQD